MAPEIASDAWVAPDANLIGNVAIKAAASVWFGATLRGDNERNPPGARGRTSRKTACLHTDPGYPLQIGANCTIGHKAMLHGCVIGDGSLIGMGATVLNGAVIGEGCLIGACALITEGKVIPPGITGDGQPGQGVARAGCVCARGAVWPRPSTTRRMRGGSAPGWWRRGDLG